MPNWLKKMSNCGGLMRGSEKSEGHSLNSSNKQIKDLEAHCRKVHAEAVIESKKIAFSAPLKVADKLFSKGKALDRGKATTS